MPDYQEHENQAQHNLSFLCDVNHRLDKYLDWQVTICFYAALHLINSHLRRSLREVDFATHEIVNNYINPSGRIKDTRLDEDTYASYRALQTLSRRARYLRNEKAPEKSTFTGDKHLGKAIFHLDKIMLFMQNSHGFTHEPVEINSPSLQGKKLNFIKAK